MRNFPLLWKMASPNHSHGGPGHALGYIPRSRQGLYLVTGLAGASARKYPPVIVPAPVGLGAAAATPCVGTSEAQSSASLKPESKPSVFVPSRKGSGLHLAVSAVPTGHLSDEMQANK